LRFCDLLDVNLEKAIQEKLVKNAEKYPVTLSKGNAKKYNQRGD
ncbi:MAG: nucleotide pyrophosphohydrolase, partial [Gammaproteobacteria bacterium]|nr:nucleotide pyrophosphohydrolase [Gammaproteobacteria bacterium]